MEFSHFPEAWRLAASLTVHRPAEVCTEGQPAGRSRWTKENVADMEEQGPANPQTVLPSRVTPLCTDHVALCRPRCRIPGGSGQTQLLPPRHSQWVSGAGQVAGQRCLPPPGLLRAAPGDMAGRPGGPGVPVGAWVLPLCVGPHAGPASI